MSLTFFLISRAASVFGLQMLACTLVFRAVHLGVGPYGLSQLGLAATVSSLICAFPIGHLIDHMKIKSAILISHFTLLSVAALIAYFDPQSFMGLLAVAAIIAATRNFRSVSQFTVLGRLLPQGAAKNRWINLSTLSWQIAAVAAPLCAGLLGSGQLPLVIACGCLVISLVCQFAILPSLPALLAVKEDEPVSLISFLRGNRKISSALLLDFAVVFFAGASSLLPFLHAGHQSTMDIGILRSALPAGIIFGTFVQLRWFRESLESWARSLAIATAGYGVCHLALAVSSEIGVSCILLFGAGLFDALSLSVRECLLQNETPAALKGRVSALNNFLVNASDELSEWESGVAANLLGVRAAIRTSGIAAVMASIAFTSIVSEKSELGKSEISAP